ncbi:MAG: hypothetical protein UV73_C0004G0002 [Candidatus Gottesmanbacteria bacterium GW2011_GWA2_43_14]|uniref:Uncharacterized protein n=1 Tax=Candidatus Gottesmanbacteria bacterium GW2011_GWA2_43_14 TaxID=1618443 RepID=A0A0G1DJ34_9BACT|nr:MAG: hypothetical protein UV73_C0004G0002 [Candidatus Gottesmanbacteria bacterium GW2011_GWA2_43_14]
MDKEHRKSQLPPLVPAEKGDIPIGIAISTIKKSSQGPERKIPAAKLQPFSPARDVNLEESSGLYPD